MLTQKELKAAINYSPESGIFTWPSRFNPKVRKNLIAGANSHGYIIISVKGIRYLAHRLVWLYVHGYFPENQIDHINRDRGDNKLANLREVSQTCNNRNTGNNRTNTSGVKGARYRADKKKWVAYVKINNIHYDLGYYDSKDNAVCARLAVEQCLDWDGCDSSSPAYQYVKNMFNTNI